MVHRLIAAGFATSLLLASRSLTGVPQGAFFLPLGDLPGGAFESRANAISADGSTVVGASRDASGLIGFIWTAESGMVPLGQLDPALLGQAANDVSGDGTVILTPTMRWSAGDGATVLVDPTGEINGVQAISMSADGSTIVGIGWLADASGTVAFRWTATTGATNAGALANDLGFVDAAGTSISHDGSVFTGQSMSFGFAVEPIRWTAGTGLVGLGDAPGGQFYAIAWGISGDGTTLVGSARTSQVGVDEAFLWRADSDFVMLDPLHGWGMQLGSTAQAASHDGSVIVGYDEALGGAAMWDAVRGRRSVAEVLQTEFNVDLTGWELLSVSDVSAEGTRLVGQGRNPSGNLEAWIAGIPRPGPVIPATSPLGVAAVSLGLLGAGWYVLRSRQSC